MCEEDMPNSSRPLSAYEDMRRQLANARGAVTTGFVRCPLCNTKATSQKRFSLGRGLRMHFASVHPDAGDPSPWLDEAEKLAAEGQVSSKRGDEHHKGTKPSAPPGILAARDGDLEELQRLHETGGWGPQDKDATGSLAVHWAAGSGHLRVVRWIVEELGARAAVVPSGKIRKRDGRQPVHWAARNNQVRVLRYLLSQTLVDSAGEAVKVQVDARTHDGTTPLHLACFGGSAEAALFLLERGASVQTLNDWRCDASHWGAMGGSVEVLEALKLHGARFVGLQKEGHSPLHKAAQKGRKEACAWLLDNPLSDPAARDAASKPDTDGFLPSGIAKVAGHEEVHLLLAEAGC